jgi:hypothetical protein
VRQCRIRIVSNPLRLVFQRLVVHVAHPVQGALRVGIERGKQRIEAVLGRAGGRDQLEGFARRVIRCETVDKYFGNLTSRNSTIAGVACLTRIALKQSKPVLV